MQPVHFRETRPTDLPYLVEAYRQADAAGTDVVSLERIYGLSPEEHRTLVTHLFTDEDVTGCEWDLACTHLAAAGPESTPVASLAAWVEPTEPPTSAQVRATALAYYLGAERMAAGRSRAALVALHDSPRAPGTLQLESIYISPDYRGQGILPELMQRAERRAQRAHPGLARAQIRLMNTNARAHSAYARLGYQLVAEYKATEPEYPTLLPGTGVLLMEKQLSPV